MPITEAVAGTTPGLSSALLVIYAIRLLAGSLPWGDGPNQLPYEPSELGAADAMAPAETLVLKEGVFVLRDPIRGELFVVNPSRGVVQRLSLQAAASGYLSGAAPVAFAMATTPAGKIAVVAGGRSRPQNTFRYVLCFFLPSGVLEESSVPLEALAGIADAPKSLHVAESGNIWVVFRQQAVLLDAEGNRLKAVGVPGIVLAGGVYLTNEPESRLFGPDGSPQGTVKITTSERPPRFVAAGPDDVLLAPCRAEKIPEKLSDSLNIMDVYKLNRTLRKIQLHDRIAWPAPTLQTPPTSGQEDGLPVKSYFPPGSLAFDTAGDLWVLEHTSAQCRFHVFRRISQFKEWPRKFSNLSDLSAAELDLYRAEARCRLGRADEAGSLGSTYKGMVWMREKLLPTDTPEALNLLKSLNGARPAPHR